MSITDIFCFFFVLFQCKKPNKSIQKIIDTSIKEIKVDKMQLLIEKDIPKPLKQISLIKVSIFMAYLHEVKLS